MPALSEDRARKILYARGYKNAYTMSGPEVFKHFQLPNPKSPRPVPKKEQRTIDEFGKGGAFNPVNTRTVAACKRYYEAGIAGQECKTVLQQAQQYERMVGRDIFGIDAEKLTVYSVLPRIIFGMNDKNVIYIKNWYNLPQQDKMVLSPYFDSRGLALPGKSGTFIKDHLPKGRQEKRMFETFNIIHGLDIEITPEGYVMIPNFQEMDTSLSDLLEFYFTPDGYAKMYFQNGFMSRLGLKFREHVPSKIKTREQLLRIFQNIKQEEHTPSEIKHILHEKNPSLKTNIDKIHPIIANQMLSRYRVYTKLSSFLNEELMFLGTTSLADSIFKVEEGFEESKGALSSTYYHGSKLGIAIADPYAVNPNKIQWFIEQAIKYRWIPEGCNKTDYVTAHEFAHGLIHVYDLVRDPRIREIELKLLSEGDISKEVGLHAKMNTREFIADCWSEYVLSEHPRETAMKVGDRIMKFLQKKVIVL